MTKNNIFEVDVMGLRQLQDGKPKWFIIRELLQNALDEEITECNISMDYERGKAFIMVTDDSPIGFRDLTDAYTLFKDTYKRGDATKRGRFNFGEKQVLCLCDFARISSTTGTVEFDLKKGMRTQSKVKREIGSEIYVEVKMSRDEFDECLNYLADIKPQKITITVDHGGIVKTFRETDPHKKFSAILKTEIKQLDLMKIVSRETEVLLYKEHNNYIYEIGIPICEIDCEYSIDVQQRVPMSTDRDKVDQKYLKDLFALVLNNTVDEIDEENISQTWIREAMDSDKVVAETIMDVKEKRFGEDAVIFNPLDPVANDEAIAKGYKLIYGSEMSANEWSKMKEHGGLVSSSKMFGYGNADDAVTIEPNDKQKRIKKLCHDIASEFLNLKIGVSFYKSKKATVLAQYGGCHLSFNLTKIPADWFEPDEHGYVRERMLDLIIHELAHSRGMHTEHSYHDCITYLGAALTRKGIYDKIFFNIQR